MILSCDSSKYFLSFILSGAPNLNRGLNLLLLKYFHNHWYACFSCGTGSAIVEDLIAAGFQVAGLALSDASTYILETLGVEVSRGVADSDGVIHYAFIHDFSILLVLKEGPSCYSNTRHCPWRIQSSFNHHRWDLGSATSDGTRSRVPGEAPRVISEETTVLFSKDVRFAFHLDTRKLWSQLFIHCHYTRTGYIGDGWPAVHHVDTAGWRWRNVSLGSPKYHGIADEIIPFRDIVQVIGKHPNIPVVGKPIEEAVDHFGWIGQFISFDNPISSKQTRQEFPLNISVTGL